MSSLAIISSPLQLLSLGEYSYQTKTNKCIIIVLYQNQKELEQINSMSNIYNFNENFQPFMIFTISMQKCSNTNSMLTCD